MKTKNILKILLILAFGFPVRTSAAFLDYGWGARPTGMGGAFTAVADDANAPLWNPAGIGRIGAREIMFMTGVPYMGLENVDISFNFASIVVPLNGNIFGLSWTSFSSSYQYSENAFNFTYSRPLTESFFIGGNIKYLGHSYLIAGFDDPVFDSGESSKYGIDADVGFLFCMPNKFCIGGTIKNIIEADLGLYDVDRLNKEVRAGIAYFPRDNITIAVDVDYKEITWIEIYGGAEAWFMNRKAALRAGTNYRNKKIHEITAGATLRQMLGDKLSIKADYCVVFPLTIIGNNLTHRLALTMGF